MKNNQTEQYLAAPTLTFSRHHRDIIPKNMYSYILLSIWVIKTYFQNKKTAIFKGESLIK